MITDDRHHSTTFPRGRVYVRSLATLYGGGHKDQTRRLVRIPAGSVGRQVVVTRGEHGCDVALVRFDGPLWVRCAPGMVEVVNG